MRLILEGPTVSREVHSLAERERERERESAFIDRARDTIVRCPAYPIPDRKLKQQSPIVPWHDKTHSVIPHGEVRSPSPSLTGHGGCCRLARFFTQSSPCSDLFPFYPRTAATVLSIPIDSCSLTFSGTKRALCAEIAAPNESERRRRAGAGWRWAGGRGGGEGKKSTVK
jgi:hypothetical protein